MTSDQGQNEPRFEAHLATPPSVDIYDRDDGARSGRPRRTRWFTAAIAVAALGSFAAVAWYATSKGQKDPGAVVPIITADRDPVKERPAEPGGIDIPNRNLQVFNRITPESLPQKVERLLPPAETPVARPAAEAAPPAGPLVPDAPPIKAPVDVVKAPEPVAPVMSEAREPPAAKPAPGPAKAAAPAAPAKQVAAIAGAWRIQLGSVKDEARAKAAAARIQKANGELLGSLNLDIRRADLGPKGVYYRMQMGPLKDRTAAAALCQKLAARKVGCIPVKP